MSHVPFANEVRGLLRGIGADLDAFKEKREKWNVERAELAAIPVSSFKEKERYRRLSEGLASDRGWRPFSAERMERATGERFL